MPEAEPVTSEGRDRTPGEHRPPLPRSSAIMKRFDTEQGATGCRGEGRDLLHSGRAMEQQPATFCPRWEAAGSGPPLKARPEFWNSQVQVHPGLVNWRNLS